MSIPHLPEYEPSSANLLLAQPSCPEKSVNVHKIDARSQNPSYVHKDLTQSPSMLPQLDSFKPAESLEEKPELRKAFTLPNDESANAFLNGRSGSTDEAIVESSDRQIQQPRAIPPRTITSSRPDNTSSNHLADSHPRQIGMRPRAHPGPTTPRPRMTMLQAKRFVEGTRTLSRHELELKRRLKDRDHVSNGVHNHIGTS
jgi:hypothetical protein